MGEISLENLRPNLWGKLRTVGSIVRLFNKLVNFERRESRFTGAPKQSVAALGPDKT